MTSSTFDSDCWDLGGVTCDKRSFYKKTIWNKHDAVGSGLVRAFLVRFNVPRWMKDFKTRSWKRQVIQNFQTGYGCLFYSFRRGH